VNCEEGLIFKRVKSITQERIRISRNYLEAVPPKEKNISIEM
jgi:hypothetical protein